MQEKEKEKVHDVSVRKNWGGVDSGDRGTNYSHKERCCELRSVNETSEDVNAPAWDNGTVIFITRLAHDASWEQRKKVAWSGACNEFMGATENKAVRNNDSPKTSGGNDFTTLGELGRRLWIWVRR